MARKPKPWFRKQVKRWYVTIRGVQHRLTEDKKESEKLFHELMAERPKKVITTDSVAVIFDQFIEWMKSRRAPDTVEWYNYRLQLFLDTIPVDLRVSSLKVHHVDDFLGKYNHLASGSQRNLCRSVKRALRWAEQQGRIERSPIAHMEQPAGGRREQVISPKEHKTILAQFKDEEFRDLLTVHFDTGCRVQESLRVEARHVDLANQRWVFPVAESKGKKRIRVVYLTANALRITKKLMKRYPMGKLFRNTDGVPWTTDAVNCRFCRVEKELGVKYCLTAYRHSFGTRMLEKGADALVVAALMGHSDLSMLGRVYAHLSQNPKHLLSQLKRA